MASYTIKSRHLGEVTFFVPDSGGYVRVENGKNHGTLGTQICVGGRFRGPTVIATPDTLAIVARRWWKQFVSHTRS